MSRFAAIVVIAALVVMGGALIILASEYSEVQDESSVLYQRLEDAGLERIKLEEKIADLKSELEAAENKTDRAVEKAERRQQDISDLNYAITELLLPVLDALPEGTPEERVRKVAVELFYYFTQVYQKRDLAWEKIEEALDEVRTLFPIVNREQRGLLAKAVYTFASDGDVLWETFSQSQMNELLDTLGLFALETEIEM